MKKKIIAIMLSAILVVLLVPVGTSTRSKQINASAYSASLLQTELRQINTNLYEGIVDFCETTVNAEMRRVNFNNSEFCEYSLLVMFRQEYSMSYSLRGNFVEFEEFTINDFPELSNIKSIRCVTAGIEIAQKQIVSMYSNRGVISRFVNSQTLQAMDNREMSVELDSFRRIKHIEFTHGSRQNILNSIHALNQRPDVVSAEPNIIHRIAPTIHEYCDHSLCDISSNNFVPNANAWQQWALNTTNVQHAWDITRGSPDVIVGIIDSGVQANHPDLVGRAYTRFFRCFVPGSTFSRYEDRDGHGTMTAGIISTNGIGTFGVAPNVRFASLRIFAGRPSGETWEMWTLALINAVAFASAPSTFIPILNASVGRFENSAIMRQQIQQYPGLFVASAGNHDRCNDTHPTPNFPSSFPLTNIIAVGASDRFNDRSVWNPYLLGGSDHRASSWGRNSVHVFAPGGRHGTPSVEYLRTTIRTGGYGWYDGTSAAAPHVAGAIALIMSHRPNLSRAQIRNAIMNSVNRDVCAEIRNGSVAGGILNVYGALRIAEIPASQSILGPTTASVFSQVTLTVNPALRPRHIEWRINYNNLMWSYQPGSNTIRIIGIMPGTFHINAIVDGINFVHTIRFT